MRKLILWCLPLFMLTGCAIHHDVAFQDINYVIAGERFRDTGAVAVIDEQTLNNQISIRSFMTGIANSWDAQPGQMLKQVVDMEFPQMFQYYSFSTSYQEPMQGDRKLTIEMTIPSYTFEDFKATVTVNFRVFEPGKKQLLSKSYTAQGITQGGKMFWGGAFAMKSAIRQSSFDAYKKIFEMMRTDLRAALAKA